MQFVHVKSLEEYHPGYKDRELQWCKAYFKMINADPDFEMLDEIDRWRFLAFVMLELQIKKPVPLNDDYLRRKGFDLKKRPMSLTLKMLHNSLDIVTEDGQSLCPREEEDKDKEEDKEKEKRGFQKPTLENLKDYFSNPETGGLEAASALVEASKFLNHYEAVGWVVGKARKPMKNWRGAAATWITNCREWGKNGQSGKRIHQVGSVPGKYSGLSEQA